MVQKSDEKKPKPRGQKPLVDPFTTKKNIERLKRLSGNGLTHEKIAIKFGMSVRSFYNLMDRNPKIRDYLLEGKADTEDGIADALINDARNGNTTAQIFFLKARAGWKEKQEIEVSGTVKHDLDVAVRKKLDEMSVEQKRARLAELEKMRELRDAEAIEVDFDEID